MVGLPILWNHNMDELIGIVRSAYLDSSKEKKKVGQLLNYQEIQKHKRYKEILDMEL